MLEVGILVGLTAFFFSPFSVRDYWHPEFIFPSFPIEDFMYGFLYGGFLSEAVDLFLSHRIRRHKSRLIYLIFSVVCFTLLFYIMVKILLLNSIWFLLLFGFVIGMSSLMFNRKIFKYQVLSGIIGLVLAIIIFQILLFINPNFIIESWKIENLTGILWLGIPLEEHLFAFIFGFGICHFYEVIAGKDIVPKKK